MKKLLSMLFVIVSLFTFTGCQFIDDLFGDKTESQKDPESTYTGNYYNSISAPTVENLNELIRAGFIPTSYDFAGKGEGLIIADKLENGKVFGIYNDMEFDADWKAGKNFEREHVWCNSLLGMSRVTGSGKNQASDLHNLRAIGGVYSGGINQTRSNRYFTSCDSKNCDLDKDNDPTTHKGHAVGTKAFYPGEDHIGDVARILMYMIVMYKDVLKVPEAEDVIIAADDHAYDVDWAYMPIASIDLLIDWNKADPVNDFEIKRNERIFDMQKNRNPFIDNPQWVELIIKEV